MKRSVLPHMVAPLALAMMAPLSAQNLPGDEIHPSSDASLRQSVNMVDGKKFRAQAVIGDRYQVPVATKAEAKLPSPQSEFMAQDIFTLGERIKSQRDIESVVDLDLLRQPSPYRKVAMSSRGSTYMISTTGLQDGLERISATYSQSGQTREDSDCKSLILSIEQRLKMDPDTVIAVVSEETSANPSCVCEIVKTAIRITNADVDSVVVIAEAAIAAAPEHMRMISQCAIAEMPDSLSGVQALLARLDPNSGDSGASAKGAKSAKGEKAAVASVVTPPNPLDLPPIYIIPPPPIFPPPVTDVDPQEPKYCEDIWTD